ncbi:MAG: HNH endonuclease [Candidatus Zipacnadales bacterium]
MPGTSEYLVQLQAELTAMRRLQISGTSKPHKLLMLLAVLDLFDSGEVTTNRIYYDPGLAERFSAYFRAIASPGDWCQPGPPFFHLKSAGFWRHKPLPGREGSYDSLRTSGGGTKRIVDNIEYAYLSEHAYSVFADTDQRAQLRKFIIETFFSEEQQVNLWKVVAEQSRVSGYEAGINSGGRVLREETASEVRNAAFSRAVRRAYDYRCAMCGLRIIGPDGATPVDAAHLIPSSISRDDTIGNGVALCKLHHWALDAGMVSPAPGYVWTVSPLLDRRRNSEKELTRFHRRRILLPIEEAHWPRMDAINWRLERLAR